MYRTPDREFSMHIYPKLPMKNEISRIFQWHLDYFLPL